MRTQTHWNGHVAVILSKDELKAMEQEFDGIVEFRRQFETHNDGPRLGMIATLLQKARKQANKS